ncbi:DUF4180 domain-containing protein [Fodinicola acaciae]|uniref:DUF4180 domain-containing protein n=1 Tax=Fodinicola acaciae TaxID=2681555 RepID=UPI0013D022AF|nr:DUF4180 domain-containing protein [Fodinicola acaciae]
MPDQLRQIHGVPVYVCAPDGALIGGERDAVDLLGDMAAGRAEMIAIPVERLVPDFFRLRTGIAGAVVQKFVGYHTKVAIVGDVSAYAVESGPLRDWIRESNNGRDLWFTADLAELEKRLGG